jgi:acyl-CoA synthetase (AMP-forming)/AMP-acid ligase II
MRYQELEAAIAGVTGPEGPFPLHDVTIDGTTRRVFGGLPDNLRDLYAFSATYGDKDCLVYGDKRLTFSDVLGQVSALSHALTHRYGIRKGDRVAIAMRNTPEWCISFMAITALGAVAVPMNSWWQGEELAFGLEDSAVSLAILDGPRHAGLAGWLETKKLPVIGLDTGGAELPASLDRLDTLLNPTGEHAWPDIEINPEDPALILYTSGSTGHPRGVISTQRNVISAIGTWLVVVTSMAVIEGTIGQEPEVQPAILLTIPLFHVTGLNALFLLSLIVGRKVVVMHKWDIDAALELIQSERITHFNGVPTMSMELLNHPRLDDYDLSSLVDISSGGAARPADQVARIVEQFPGAAASVGYGLTETNAVGAVAGQEDYHDRPRTVGKPTLPLVEVKIVDEEDTVLSTGEIGEIWIRSPAVASGYLNMPEATAAAFRDGWFCSGDLGYLDEEGFLYIVDRLKDIIIRGGENISCLEVEEALYAHPEILEAAVFALPDERLGEIVGTAIMTRAGNEIDVGQIRTFLTGRLAAFKMPQHVWCFDGQLPRIASGKIAKKQLRSEMVDRLGL